ncbi:penicillin-binding protein 2 [Calorimonas adulescens]|jgi:penicillin-binding protein 2|uniref:Penicillin-binding protein 2 n=1 Tax=Calorimonas adulescens TaxID=2606906 RepID=A0A5D8QC27_9THEO|nr:penicillin-binding protein 2 [Calorimonas adulescens]TZE82245.1 penicillin-binding protein 2 [Calorimonas adulescens]
MDLKEFKQRFIIFIIIITFLFSVIAGRLIQLQVVQGSYYREWSDEKRLRLIAVKAPRGKIVDRNGVELANNRPSFSVDIVRTNIDDNKLNSVILDMINILKANNEEYIDSLPLFIDNTNNVYFNFKSFENEDVTEETLKAREKRWKENHKIDIGDDAKKTWEILKERYHIDDTYTMQETRDIMNVRTIMAEQGYKSYQPVTIARDVSDKTVAELEEKHIYLPGIVVDVEPIRQYPEGTLASQVLGYISRIDPETMKQLDTKKYSPDDLIGTVGIEKSFEEYLKGTDGGEYVEVDALGRKVRSVSYKEPVPGDTVKLTINADVQKAAEQGLEETMKNIREGNNRFQKSEYANIGAAVVIDVNTGEVIALASVPSFDPNVFAKGSPSVEEYAELNPQNATERTPKPLWNYATKGAIPPGSTFKMVTGIAGLTEGVVTPEEKILDTGVYPYAHRPACWLWNEYHRTHGLVNITKAIQVSCNIYFFEVARRLGIDKLAEYAKRFGLGEKTGIEIEEQAGTLASPEVLKSVAINDLYYIKNVLKMIDQDQLNELAKLVEAGETRDSVILKRLDELGIKEKDARDKILYTLKGVQWNLGMTLNASIGQGQNSFTPLQMANYIATLVNGGVRYRPHLLKEIDSFDGKVIKTSKPEVVDRLNLDQEYVKYIKEGMKAVTEMGGTASGAFVNYPITVGGKTGTAQRPPYKPYGWFVGFAPYDKPEIAVAVVIYEGGSGSYSAYVAKSIFDAYFGFNKPDDQVKTQNTSER